MSKTNPAVELLVSSMAMAILDAYDKVIRDTLKNPNLHPDKFVEISNKSSLVVSVDLTNLTGEYRRVMKKTPSIGIYDILELVQSSVQHTLSATKLDLVDDLPERVVDGKPRTYHFRLAEGFFDNNLDLMAVDDGLLSVQGEKLHWFTKHHFNWSIFFDLTFAGEPGSFFTKASPPSHAPLCLSQPILLVNWNAPVQIAELTNYVGKAQQHATELAANAVKNGGNVVHEICISGFFLYLVVHTDKAILVYQQLHVPKLQDAPTSVPSVDAQSLIDYADKYMYIKTGLTHFKVNGNIDVYWYADLNTRSKFEPIY